jgi:hypothetical protein
MNAHEKAENLQVDVERRFSIRIKSEAALTLIRCEITLQRWYEQECGDGCQEFSYAIERDEKTNKPYRVVYPNKPGSKSYRIAIADKELCAEKRIASACKESGLHFYLQTDPRGCALYVADKPMKDSSYSMQGIPCC